MLKTKMATIYKTTNIEYDDEDEYDDDDDDDDDDIMRTIKGDQRCKLFWTRRATVNPL